MNHASAVKEIPKSLFCQSSANVNVAGGANNIVSGNVLENLGQILPCRPAIGTIWHNAGVIPGTDTVPELWTWMGFVIGFGLLGGVIRRQRSGLLHA